MTGVFLPPDSKITKPFQIRVSPRTRQRALPEEASGSNRRNQAGTVQQRKGLNLAPLELSSKNSEPLRVDNTSLFDNEDDDHEEEEDDDDDDDDEKKGSNVRGCRCGRSKCLKQYCQCFR
jgi:hypothetical protein